MEIDTDVDSIAVAGVEGIGAGGEEGLDVAQTRDFEFLGLLLDDFAMEGAEQTSRVEQQRPVGQRQVVLAHRAQVLASDARLPERKTKSTDNEAARSTARSSVVSPGRWRAPTGTECGSRCS